MTPWIAAHVADPLERIDTPALILDLDAFERNLARMDEALRASRVRLRPHAKSHKCVEIARRQIERGAVGICCQKVSEAAVFVRAGIGDVLVTNEVVGAPKLRALMEITHAARIGVLVDDASQVTALSAAARAQRARPADVYVEVDVGSKRCGVAPEQAAALAAMIHADPNLRFGGLHCYHGAAQHLRTIDVRSLSIRVRTSASRHGAGRSSRAASADQSGRGRNSRRADARPVRSFVNHRHADRRSSRLEHSRRKQEFCSLPFEVIGPGAGTTAWRSRSLRATSMSRTAGAPGQATPRFAGNFRTWSTSRPCSRVCQRRRAPG